MNNLLNKEYSRNFIDESVRQEVMNIIKNDVYMNLLLERFPGIILLFNKEVEVVFANKSFFMQTNILSEKFILGKTCEDIFQPYTSNEFILQIKKLITQTVEERVYNEIEIDIDWKHNNNVKHYSIQFAPINNNIDLTSVMAIFYII